MLSSEIWSKGWIISQPPQLMTWHLAINDACRVAVALPRFGGVSVHPRACVGKYQRGCSERDSLLQGPYL